MDSRKPAELTEDFSSADLAYVEGFLNEYLEEFDEYVEDLAYVEGFPGLTSAFVGVDESELDEGLEYVDADDSEVLSEGVSPDKSLPRKKRELTFTDIAAMGVHGATSFPIERMLELCAGAVVVVRRISGYVNSDKEMTGVVEEFNRLSDHFSHSVFTSRFSVLGIFKASEKCLKGFGSSVKKYAEEHELDDSHILVRIGKMCSAIGSKLGSLANALENYIDKLYGKGEELAVSSEKNPGRAPTWSHSEGGESPSLDPELDEERGSGLTM